MPTQGYVEDDPLRAERHRRHLSLPEVGPEGQKKLRAGRVLVVGAGGLGSASSLYLVAAGVGAVGLADFDAVELSNLQRQVLHGAADVGRLKVESARDRLLALDPGAKVEIHPVRLSRDNALDLIARYDVVVDGTDNFPSRYVLNDACVTLGKPYVYGAVCRFEGQASVMAARGGPCYRCFFAWPPPPEPSPSNGGNGVLGALPGLIGCIQAAETLKLLLDCAGQNGRTLAGRLLLVDAWTMSFRTIPLRRDPVCPACGGRPALRETADCVGRIADPRNEPPTRARRGHGTEATHGRQYGRK